MRPAQVSGERKAQGRVVAERTAPGRTALVASSVSFLAVGLVASAPDSPLQPVLPTGVTPSGPFHWLSQTLGITSLSGSVLVALSVCAITGAAGAFAFLVYMAWRGRVSVTQAIALSVCFNLAVLLLPLLVSRDVYSYALYGRIAGVHHANPYVLTPGSFRTDPLFPLVGPKWVSSPDVYGPLFTLIASFIARAIASIQGLVDAFRMIAVASSLATLWFIAKIARRMWPARTAFAIVAFGANPAVVLQSVGSGHNDLLVGLSIAVAAWLVLGRRLLVAVGVLALGTMIKATAALPLLLLIVASVATRPRGDRLRTAAVSVGLAAAVAAVLAAPFFQTSDPTLGMSALATHEGWLAPSRLFDRMFTAIGGFGVVARIGFAAILVAIVLALWLRLVRDRTSGRSGDIASWGWALIALMLLGPVLLPWYAVPGLALIGFLPRAPRIVLLGTSIALTVSQWAAEPTRYRHAYDVNVWVGHYLITPVVVGLAAWFVVDLLGRLRSHLPLDEPAQEVASPSER
jgi:alpha-1,6-mannosyltransferase